MATSQNGGTVLEYGDPRLITTVIPGTNDAKFVGGVAGADLNTVFMYIGYRWNTEIEPINAGWNWGHNVRSIRGQTSGYSNHAAGEAIDINAPKHPLGTQTLTAAQLGALRSIASDLIGVIRFGAFYSGRKDEMHAEKIGTSGQVSALAARIRRGDLPNVPAALRTDGGTAPQPTPQPTPQPQPTPAPQPASTGEPFVAWPPAPYKTGQVVEQGDRVNDGIRKLQRRLNDHIRFTGGQPMSVDGDFGPTTERWVRWFQGIRGLKADGRVGPTTWASLWR